MHPAKPQWSNSDLNTYIDCLAIQRYFRNVFEIPSPLPWKGEIKAASFDLVKLAKVSAHVQMLIKDAPLIQKKWK